MREQLFLLLRVSKADYNRTLYEDYTLYMNPQLKFAENGLTVGQQDKMEGAFTQIPSQLLYSTDQRKTWRSLGTINNIRINYYVYIYCMYGLKYDSRFYNPSTNKYFYVIPWSFIKQLWQGNDTEMIVVSNTQVFIDKFLKAAEKNGLSCRYGRVSYDLQDRLKDKEYLELVMKDTFESAFHKMADGYEEQKEIRFCVRCPQKPSVYKLKMEKEPKLLFTTIPLEYGKSIGVELSDLEFDAKSGLPIRFSNKINYYESQ